MNSAIIPYIHANYDNTSVAQTHDVSQSLQMRISASEQEKSIEHITRGDLLVEKA